MRNEISEVTRRSIIDVFRVAQVNWTGRLSDDKFLSRLYELSELPFHDHRSTDFIGSD